MSLVEINVTVGGPGARTEAIVVYRGMPADELQDTFHTVFQRATARTYDGGDLPNLGRSSVYGVRDRLGTVFPVSLITKTPSFFKEGVYELVGAPAGSERVMPRSEPAARSRSAPPAGGRGRSGTVSRVFDLQEADYTQIVNAFRCVNGARERWGEVAD